MDKYNLINPFESNNNIKTDSKYLNLILNLEKKLFIDEKREDKKKELPNYISNNCFYHGNVNNNVLVNVYSDVESHNSLDICDISVNKNKEVDDINKNKKIKSNGHRKRILTKESNNKNKKSSVRFKIKNCIKNADNIIKICKNTKIIKKINSKNNSNKNLNNNKLKTKVFNNKNTDKKMLIDKTICNKQKSTNISNNNIIKIKLDKNMLNNKSNCSSPLNKNNNQACNRYSLNSLNNKSNYYMTLRKKIKFNN